MSQNFYICPGLFSMKFRNKYSMMCLSYKPWTFWSGIGTIISVKFVSLKQVMLKYLPVTEPRTFSLDPHGLSDNHSQQFDGDIGVLSKHQRTSITKSKLVPFDLVFLAKQVAPDTHL